MPLREITPQRVAAWQADRIKAGAGRPVVRKALRLLGGILAYAVEQEHLQVNAARAVRPVRVAKAKTGHAVSVCEVEALRAAVGEPWDVLLAVLAYTGLRPAEALALRWADIGEHTIRVDRALSLTGDVKSTKTEAARSGRLLAPVAADLAAWRLRCGRPAKTAAVLPHPSGKGWSKVAWDNLRERQFQPAAVAIGLGTIAELPAVKGTRPRRRYEGLRPYDLRHTFASLLLAEGRSLHYVAE